MIKRKIKTTTTYGKVYKTNSEEFLHMLPTTKSKVTWLLFGFIPIYTSEFDEVISAKKDNSESKTNKMGF